LIMICVLQCNDIFFVCFTRKCIIDVVYLCNQQLALVDAPNMERSQMSFKSPSLIYIKIKIGRIPKKKVLIGVMEDACKLPSLSLLVFRESDNYKKWESICWGKKFIVQKKIASFNDFDRFKVMLAKIKFLRRKVAKLDQQAA
ncbi:hypothetical protein MKX01_022823, partial [Papaver californicum]